MQFNIKDYPGKVAMHCKTKEEVESFCSYLDSMGIRTCIYRPYNADWLWNKYGTETTINFNEGCHCGLWFYRTSSENFTILEWEDFMNKTFTKADLKNGDIVKFENGEVGCVIKEHNMIITRFCWIDLENYTDDMSSKVSPQYSIKSVRRPRGGRECRFDAFEENRGELVYDRERDTVVEMTMDEICAALGKTIKIVKE